MGVSIATVTVTDLINIDVARQAVSLPSHPLDHVHDVLDLGVLEACVNHTFRVAYGDHLLTYSSVSGRFASGYASPAN